MSVFTGLARSEDRIALVVRMLGHADEDIQSEVLRDFVTKLLRRAEQVADDWLQNEIAECLRGAEARRAVKQRYR